MVGVVDVGGGLRDIYGSGILDYCMDQGIQFDCCIGVSAGSANMASYLAGQRGRNYVFYTEYAFRREYMSFYNWVTQGSFVDLDYIYSTLSNDEGENPVDYDALAVSEAKLFVVATDAETGEPVFFDKTHVRRNCYDILKASSAIPVFCRPYVIDGKPYYDGGISCPIPVKEAFEAGCNRVVLILTRPADFIRTGKKDKPLSRLLNKKYPKAAEALRTRYKTYNDAIAALRPDIESGRVLLLAPDDCCGVDTLKKKKENLIRLYEKGYRDGEKITQWLEK